MRKTNEDIKRTVNVVKAKGAVLERIMSLIETENYDVDYYTPKEDEEDDDYKKSRREEAITRIEVYEDIIKYLAK